MSIFLFASPLLFIIPNNADFKSHYSYLFPFRAESYEFIRHYSSPTSDSCVAEMFISYSALPVIQMNS